MNRRRFLVSTAAFTLVSTTAARADYVEDIVKWLEKHGYSGIEVTRTLLGRVRIVAGKDGGRRELICNPRTGEILRDIWISADGNTGPPISSSSGGTGRGGTGSSGDEGDDDDDGEDSGKDDKSGDDDGSEDEEDDGGSDDGGDDDRGGDD